MKKELKNVVQKMLSNMKDIKVGSIVRKNPDVITKEDIAWIEMSINTDYTVESIEEDGRLKLKDYLLSVDPAHVIPQKVLLLENQSLLGIRFSIGKESKLLSAKSIQGIKEHLNGWIEYYEFWSHYVNYYSDYGIDKIKEDLDTQEKNHSENFSEYQVGDNFAAFLKELGYESNGGNNEAADEISRRFRKSSERNNYLRRHLIFDPEYSHCYVYAKNREAAEAFLLFVWTDIIEPVITKIKNNE